MLGKFMTSALLAASVSFGGIAAVNAAPMPAQPGIEIGSGIVKVQDRRNRHYGERRYNGGNRHYSGRRGFYRHDGNPYYNGQRGYRQQRPGYRNYNGYWFPAFAFGLLLAPQLTQPGTIYLTPAHVRWCENRFRSYRRSDNTYQPYNGPRKACVSPYMR